MNMSQVRKLLQGNGGIPKTYNLILDGQSFTINDDQLREINNEIASLDPKYRAYLGNVSGVISSGAFVGNRAQNTISAPALTNLNEKEMEFLKAGKQNLWETITDSNTYRVKQAINEALNIISGVVNKKPLQEKTQQKDDKKIAYNRLASFDYDKEGDTWVYSKSNPRNDFIEGRFGSYLDWLSDEKWEDTNRWETALGDNEAILRSWYNGNNIKGSRDAAQAAINTAMDEVRSKPWEDVSEQTKELLAYFNIGNGSSDYTGSNKDSKIYDDNGNVRPDARTDTGGLIIQKGDSTKGEDEYGYYVRNFSTDTSQKPYLITEADWSTLGLRNELEKYKHGLIYNNRLYTEDELNQYPDSSLWRIMQNVKSINTNSRLTGKERNDLLSSILSWYGSDGEYNLYDYNSDTDFILDNTWRQHFNGNNYSFFDATRYWDGLPPNTTIIGYYDYNNPSNLPWGFRTPSYYIKNSNGTWSSNLSQEGLTSNPFAYLDAFQPKSYFGTYDPETKYGIYRNIYDTSTRKEAQILIDKQGNYFIRYGKKLVPVSETLKQKILNTPYDKELRLTGAELSKGKLYDETTGRFMRSGGKVDYIAKLQTGLNIPSPGERAQFTPIKKETIDPAYIFDESGEFDWDSLPPQDKNEFRAMGLDLLGAIAGWFGPYGSIAGGIAGLGGTAFNTTADIQRRRGFWGTLGSTAVNAGLDVVSVIPELGEIAEIAKLGRTVKRIAKNAKLINWVGKAFNAYGLASAYEPFMKVINGGFKDLTTDEAYALANGLRVIMSASRTKLQNRGDAQLAEAIANERVNQGLNTPRHQKVMQIAPDVTTKFTEADIADIHNAGENAGSVLRSKLETLGADKSKLEVNDDALLTRFGFAVTKDNTGKVTGVTSPEGYTLDTHNRSVTRTDAGKSKQIPLDDEDVRTILAGNDEAGSRLRNILINKWGVDPSKINTDDAKLLKEFGFGVRTRHVGANKGKIIDVYIEDWKASAKTKLNPDEKYSKYGYLTDLFNGSSKRKAFIDKNLRGPENEGGPIRDAIDDLMRTTGDNAPSRAMQRAYARSQYRIGNQPILSGNHRFMPNLSSTEVNTGNSNSSSASNPLPRPSIETPRTKQSVVEAMRNNTGFDAYRRAESSSTATETPVQSAMKKAYSTPVMTNITERNRSRRSQKRVAANLEKLRKSSDPMKTLAEISDIEAKELINDNRKFESALSEAIQKLVNEGKLKTTDDVKTYYQNIMKLFRGINLDKGYKRGGIIKAQNGGYTVQWKWTDENGAQRIDTSHYEGDVPEDVLMTMLKEEREKRGVWKSSGIEGTAATLVYPEYTLIKDETPQNSVELNNGNVEVQHDSGNTQHLLPDVSSSSNLGTASYVSPYTAFDFIARNPSGLNLQIPVTPLTKQKITKVKTNKQKDFNDLVNVLEGLLQNHKNGGVLKVQNGTPSVPKSITPYMLPSDIYQGLDPNTLWYRNNLDWSTWNNGRVYPGLDWGTIDNGVFKPLGLLDPAPYRFTTLQAYQMAGEDTFKSLYPGYNKPDLTSFGQKPVVEEEVQENTPIYVKPESIKTKNKISSTSFINENWTPPVLNFDPNKKTLDDIANSNPLSKYPTEVAGTNELDLSFEPIKNQEFDPNWQIPKPDWYKGELPEGGEQSGGFTSGIGDKTKWINPALSTLRYGLNAWAQRRNLELGIKAINAARFNEIPVWENILSVNNPVFDRQLQQVHQERMAGLNGIPATNDWVAHNAILNQREGQLWDRENDIYSKQSAHEWDIKRENLNIMNQNLANAINARNRNAERTATLNSAIEQQKQAFIQQLNQSRQNALLEIQNNVNKDRKTMIAYEQNKYNSDQERAYDSWLKSHYPDQAATYAGMDYVTRSKYTDLEDYILRTNPSATDAIMQQRRTMMQNQLDWMRQNTLNYDYGIFAGRQARTDSRTYKKGGRLRGHTRYTLEPDERIWIDNNKAAHAAVAKLSDNVIKLILKALK